MRHPKSESRPMIPANVNGPTFWGVLRGEGRIGIVYYWVGILAVMACNMMFSRMMQSVGPENIDALTGFSAALIVWFWFTLMMRRAHDLGFGALWLIGAWVLWTGVAAFVDPTMGVVFTSMQMVIPIVLGLIPGARKANAFGPRP